eukprot:4765277-Prymnesium_polylepis.1
MYCNTPAPRLSWTRPRRHDRHNPHVDPHGLGGPGRALCARRWPAAAPAAQDAPGPLATPTFRVYCDQHPVFRGRLCRDASRRRDPGCAAVRRHPRAQRIACLSRADAHGAGTHLDRVAQRSV